MIQALTETSAAGRYVVVTATKSVYEVTIDSAGTPEVIRRPLLAGLLLDGQPMTGVFRFVFDSRTGVGRILWSKLDPADYDEPSEPYSGTARTTSRVLLIAELTDGSEALDVIRDAVLASADDDDMRTSVRALLGL